MKATQISFIILFLLSSLVSPAISGTEKNKQETARTIMTGTVKDEKGESLSYVSVGIVNEESGTVTNEDGKFTLIVKQEYQQGIIRFSFIGYETIEIKVSDALTQFAKQKALLITLKEKPQQVKEVKVDARRWITSVKGGKSGPDATFHQAFMRTPGTIEEHLGREVALLINNRKKQAFLKKLNFCISSNKYQDVTFRVNIYSIANGQPQENILKENIYLEFTNYKTGWVEVDLEPYNIYVSDDFVIGLEWIDCFPKPKNVRFLALAGGLGTHLVFQKKASQARWQKMPGSAIGMNVTLQHEK